MEEWNGPWRVQARWTSHHQWSKSLPSGFGYAALRARRTGIPWQWSALDGRWGLHQRLCSRRCCCLWWSPRTPYHCPALGPVWGESLRGIWGAHSFDKNNHRECALSLLRDPRSVQPPPHDRQKPSEQSNQRSRFGSRPSIARSWINSLWSSDPNPAMYTIKVLYLENCNFTNNSLKNDKLNLFCDFTMFLKEEKVGDALSYAIGE